MEFLKNNQNLKAVVGVCMRCCVICLDVLVRFIFLFLIEVMYFDFSELFIFSVEVVQYAVMSV